MVGQLLDVVNQGHRAPVAGRVHFLKEPFSLRIGLGLGLAIAALASLAASAS